MKQVTKTIEKNVWSAIDGTEFEDKEECRKYEQSAKCVLTAKFLPLVVKQKNEFQIFGAGSDDAQISIVKLESQADADIVLQLYLLENPRYTDEERLKDLQELSKRIRRAADEKDFIFISHGFDGDDFWFSGSRNEHINCLNKICQPEEPANEEK